MNDDGLWVGQRKDNGSMWVFDPEMKHANESMVYAFWVTPTRMQEYSKELLRESMVTVHNERRQKAIQIYLQWKTINGESFLRDELTQTPKQREEAVKKAKQQLENIRLYSPQRTVDKHKAYLALHEKKYEGVIEGSTRALRSTICHACLDKLDSSLHHECKACGWIICNCGACGCGYSKKVVPTEH
jgi:NACalpha-BTF3-like transcription factor